MFEVGRLLGPFQVTAVVLGMPYGRHLLRQGSHPRDPVGLAQVGDDAPHLNKREAASDIVSFPLRRWGREQLTHLEKDLADVRIATPIPQKPPQQPQQRECHQVTNLYQEGPC